MTPNIPFIKPPRVEDFEDVMAHAKKECHCTAGMKSDLKHGDEDICTTCAARQVLNGMTSLAEKISE